MKGIILTCFMFCTHMFNAAQRQPRVEHAYAMLQIADLFFVLKTYFNNQLRTHTHNQRPPIYFSQDTRPSENQPNQQYPLSAGLIYAPDEDTFYFPEGKWTYTKNKCFVQHLDRIRINDQGDPVPDTYLSISRKKGYWDALYNTIFRAIEAEHYSVYSFHNLYAIRCVKPMQIERPIARRICLEYTNAFNQLHATKETDSQKLLKENE